MPLFVHGLAVETDRKCYAHGGERLMRCIGDAAPSYVAKLLLVAVYDTRHQTLLNLLLLLFAGAAAGAGPEEATGQEAAAEGTEAEGVCGEGSGGRRPPGCHAAGRGGLRISTTMNKLTMVLSMMTTVMMRMRCGQDVDLERREMGRGSGKMVDRRVVRECPKVEKKWAECWFRTAGASWCRRVCVGVGACLMSICGVRVAMFGFRSRFGMLLSFGFHDDYCWLMSSRSFSLPPFVRSSFLNLSLWFVAVVCGEQVKGKDKTPEELEAEKRKEGVRLKRKAEEERRVGLFTACRAGFVEEVREAPALTETAQISSASLTQRCVDVMHQTLTQKKARHRTPPQLLPLASAYYCCVDLASVRPCGPIKDKRDDKSHRRAACWPTLVKRAAIFSRRTATGSPACTHTNFDYPADSILFVPRAKVETTQLRAQRARPNMSQVSCSFLTGKCWIPPIEP